MGTGGYLGQITPSVNFRNNIKAKRNENFALNSSIAISGRK